MLYIGIDHHTMTSHLTVVNEAGEIVKRQEIASQFEDVRKVLGGYEEPLKAVLEAGGFVVGLTTTASLWTVAAIGMLVGTGFLLVGFIVTAVDLLVLEAIDRLMDTISPKFKRHQVPVSVAGDYSEENFGQVKDLLRSHGCKPDLLGFSRYDSGTQYDADLLTIVCGHLDIEKLTDEIYAVAGVKEVKWGQEFD